MNMLSRQEFLKTSAALLLATGFLALGSGASVVWSQPSQKQEGSKPTISGRELEGAIDKVIEEAKAAVEKHGIKLTPSQQENFERKTREVIRAAAARYHVVEDP